ncbi:glutamate/aspartate ABC transport system permease protein GltI (plasmid) [Cupriavidus necator N-1]|uniref:Glutamate/aspartate ABC transport system permease protein GltI n=1 Tax=Cupriavidus necator (strain ATCC 43291 / DSM 13513 / CCUG 52238 / LMG 8453 / N-1) TaxID=1042878 RepID=F8GUK2_CUPNN|nr:amino acid ABC transporter substrate-binding protein [Cupriavidus necator]AEI82406.1 glutamate/aspartate ABC transport system permease protein GltI [Cupriavidus necator N-1]MDX6007417.1 amino acid ABC transporter substrate-binding protein [Cupriavidus necator]
MRSLKSTLAFAISLTVTSAFAAGPGGTLEKVKETKRIVIGFQEASVPFSYLDANQKPAGFTVDICMKIVDAVKRELNQPQTAVEFTPVTAANRIPLLINGTIDLNCASATNSVERQKQVAFTNSHFLTASRFAAKKSSNLRKIEDLKGKTVVSVAGSTNINQLNKINVERNLGMNIVSAKDQLEAFLMLETGRAQAYVLDDVQLAVAIARSKDPAAYAISDDAFSKPEPYGIMLRKDDPAFKALVDRVTAGIYQSPEIDTLYKKWFQAPVPPSGINFNYPMSQALRNAYQKPSSSADPDAYVR